MSLQVKSGEIVGLLGPNGAGKTTCFYMVVGLLKVDAGNISLDGQDLTRAAVHERARAGIGYLPQTFAGDVINQEVIVARARRHVGL